jgi:hypothetical protein
MLLLEFLSLQGKESFLTRNHGSFKVDNGQFIINQSAQTTAQ